MYVNNFTMKMKKIKEWSQMAKRYEGKAMAGIWTLLRVWLGIQLAQAPMGKVLGGFDATGYIKWSNRKSGG